MQSQTVSKQCQNSAKQQCVLTPLGSPTGSQKRSYGTARGDPGRVVHDAATVWDGSRQVGIQGGYTGGYTGGYARGVLPSHRARKSHIPAKRARTALQGPGVVGIWDWTRDRRWAAPGPPLRGPVGPMLGPPCPGPLDAASWPIRRDSTSFLIKLVKTTKCHQKTSKRPAIVPVSQNGLKNSPLDFYRFPFSPAFSHKELMGHFEPWVDY